MSPTRKLLANLLVSVGMTAAALLKLFEVHRYPAGSPQNDFGYWVPTSALLIAWAVIFAVAAVRAWRRH